MEHLVLLGNLHGGGQEVGVALEQPPHLLAVACVQLVALLLLHTAVRLLEAGVHKLEPFLGLQPMLGKISLKLFAQSVRPRIQSATNET